MISPKINSKKAQINEFYTSISTSIENKEFRWDKFFQKWYRESGEGYFFLFKKNLSVTNAQFAELFALLRRNSKYSFDVNSKPNLLFHNTNHIKATFVDTINAVLEDDTGNENKHIKKFCKRYIEIYSNTISIDIFYGSCAIYFPPGIDLDLESVVFKSGYIHSAGTVVFVRNILKSRKADFITSLQSYVSSKNYEYKVPIVAYCHEDFSSDDRESKELLDKGIENNKIYVEKMSMGRFRLSTVLNGLKKDKVLGDIIQLPEAGSFKKHQNFNTKTTIWLITDRGTSGNSIKNRGQARYYILYEQKFKSDNPFYIFDENKPAWKSHTTLPHSLTAALLNISNFDKNRVICDPFGGTGTTWLEVMRMNDKQPFYSSDLSSLTKQLHSDNIEFFTLSKQKLNNLISKLDNFDYSIIESHNSIQLELLTTNTNPLLPAVKLLDEVRASQPEEEHEYDFTSELKDKLQKLEFEERLFFYLMLKAELRNKGELNRKRLKLGQAMKKEIETFKNQVGLFAKQFKNTNKVNGKYFLESGKYSQNVIPTLVNKSLDNYKEIITKYVKDSRSAIDLKSNSVDIIICDPPYGFNTMEKDEELAELYQIFITSAIEALKKDGQLIMCLPSESFTGRDLPYCTNSNIVSRQIINTANNLGREVYKPAISLPNSEFYPPYYWEADKVLSRIILHFHIRKY